MAQQIHPGDPAYAPPLIRPPSPASSIGTVYGADETSLSDSELDQVHFAEKCERLLNLHMQSDPERRAMRLVLLPKPSTAQEEKVIFEHVMTNLRKEVRKLEEDELFERTILQGSQIGQEEQPSSNDIDVIMRSMMRPPEVPHEPPVDVAGFATTLKGHGLFDGDNIGIVAGKDGSKGKARKL